MQGGIQAGGASSPSHRKLQEFIDFALHHRTEYLVICCTPCSVRLGHGGAVQAVSSKAPIILTFPASSSKKDSPDLSSIIYWRNQDIRASDLYGSGDQKRLAWIAIFHHCTIRSLFMCQFMIITTRPACVNLLNSIGKIFAAIALNNTGFSIE